MLTADSAGTLRWTPPGGTQGVSVAIANGETKQLPGGNASAYLIVTRSTAADLRGTETIVIVDAYKSVAAGGDFSSAQAITGDENYRGLFFENVSAVSVTGLTVWLDTASATHARIAKEAPTANAITDETVNGELVQPGGLTWVNPTTEGTGLSIGTLTAGALYGLWIEQNCGAGATANARVETVVNFSFTYAAVKYCGQMRGLGRIANDALDRWEEYDGVDANPDLSGSPIVTSQTSPYNTPALSASHTHNLKTAKRNKYGLMDLVMNPESFVINADGTRTGDAPTAPSYSMRAGAAGTMIIHATYAPNVDGCTGAGTTLRGDAATEWAILFTADGTSPVGATPATQAMRIDGGLEQLAYTTAAVIDGAPCQAIVRARRTDYETVSVSSITRSGTTATVTTATPHGRISGDNVTIAGATLSQYNGAVAITVTDTTHFTYTVAGSPATPATGTITSALTTPRTVDSSNTTVVTATAVYDGAARPVGEALFGRAAGIIQTPDTFADVRTWIDQAKNILWLQTSGELQLWFDFVLGFRLRYSSDNPSTNGFGYFWTIDETVSFAGAGSADAAEVISWTVGDKRVSLNVNGVRQMLFDVTNQVISFARRDRVTAPEPSFSAEPAHKQYAATCLQVWDPATQWYTTPVAIQSDGTLRMSVPLNRAADQAGVLV